jgi:hypothetical protein
MSTGTTSSDYTRGIDKCVLTAFQALPQPLGPCPSPAIPYPTTPGESGYLITKVTACPLYFAPENTAGTCSNGRGTFLLQQKLYPRIKGIEDIAVPVRSNPSSLYTSRLETSVIESSQQPNTVPPPGLLGSMGSYVIQGRFAEFFPPNIPCKKRI